MKIILTTLLTCLFVVSTSALQWGDFSYEINSPDTNTVAITGYTGTGGEIFIPAVIGQKNVTTIEDEAFRGNKDLTKVIIPDGIRSIGNSSFYNCINLTEVVLGSNLTSIGNYSFSVSSLIRITFPESVTSVGDYAFYHIRSMTELYFKGDAPSTGNRSFEFGTVYYLPGRNGWSETFANCPAEIWNPMIETGDGMLGVQSNGFGFNIIHSSSGLIVVESCTNLVGNIWIPITTNTMDAGGEYFSDPSWKNHRHKLYRISMP